MQVLVVLVASSQEQSQSFDLIQRLTPGFVQRQFGATLPAFLSFGGLVSFGYFHPVVVLMLALAAAFIATELAADVEGGQADLLLSRPLARHWLVTRSLVLALAAPVAVVTLMTLSSRLALAAFAPDGARWPDAMTVGAMAGHLVAVAWCFGAAGLAAASIARRRLSAMGPVAILAVSAYLLEVLAGAWAPIRVDRAVLAVSLLPGRGGAERHGRLRAGFLRPRIDVPRLRDGGLLAVPGSRRVSSLRMLVRLVAAAAVSLALAQGAGVHPISGREYARPMGVGGAPWLERAEREEEEAPSRALAIMNVAPGSVVADIGAGSGYFSERLSRLVGPAGKVYATDIQQGMLDLLGQRIARERLENVTLVLGTPTDPKLPPASIDMALMVDVYHEASRPATTARLHPQGA